jgi:hypothetical protein
MAENLQPEDLSTWMKDVERRLRAVESGPTLLPTQHTAMFRESDALLAVTSGTFVGTFQCSISEVVKDSVFVQFAVLTPAGTTGEVRLQGASLAGTPVTDVAVIGSDSFVNVKFAWLVPAFTVGLTAVRFVVQARRTGGAGNVTVFVPNSFMQVSGFSVDANANGNVTVT